MVCLQHKNGKEYMMLFYPGDQTRMYLYMLEVFYNLMVIISRAQQGYQLKQPPDTRLQLTASQQRHLVAVRAHIKAGPQTLSPLTIAALKSKASPRSAKPSPKNA